jgi:hypothetical protein
MVMADNSGRIIILSAVLRVVIVVTSIQLYQMERVKEGIILTWKDMEILIATSRDNYTLGEGFTATVYLFNNRSEEVRMEPITSCTITGIEQDGTSGGGTGIS